MGPTRAKLETILARLQQRSADERVFSKIYAESARAEADAADQRIHDCTTLGALDGRIVSIKDLFDVAGEPTLAGSFIRRSAAPAETDAVILERLRQAGAVIIGKTHMTEFAFTAVGLNPHYGVPGNAVDPMRVPGGSSSGAGVSVGEGTSEIAIGSDTGGSVRIPAALNGVVGFKPTARRIPLHGAFPLSPTLDSIGPLARNVADCIAADAIMAGETAVVLSPLPLADIRMGVPRGRLLELLEPDVAEAFDDMLQRLQTSGVIIADIHIDDLLDELAKAAAIGSIAGIEGSHVHADWLFKGDANVDIRAKATLERRSHVSTGDYQALICRRNELVQAMDIRLQGGDFVALPTVPMTAPLISDVEASAAIYEHVEGLLLRNTQVANQFDLCSISLPMGRDHRGLPVGLMLFGRGGTDHHLLRAALAIDQL